MTEPQTPDPISRPNSALDGFPYFIKLQFANARLERNAQPREHYDRQFSVTPERQTPESQQTPLIPLPLPDPVEGLRKAKSWAAKAARRLGAFYAGRMILRKEEPEQYGIFGQDPEYWYSQKSHWETEYEKLVEQYDRRKQLEAEGRAVDGYAEALLLTPLRSPSAPGSNNIFSPAEGPRTEIHTPKITDSPKQQQKMPDPMSKRKSSSFTKSATETRRRRWKISKANTRGISKSKELLAPRVLPWDLRPRHVISYRESGTRAAKRKTM